MIALIFVIMTTTTQIAQASGIEMHRQASQVLPPEIENLGSTCTFLERILFVCPDQGDRRLRGRQTRKLDSKTIPMGGHVGDIRDLQVVGHTVDQFCQLLRAMTGQDCSCFFDRSQCT